jgi:hypothetical protein
VLRSDLWETVRMAKHNFLVGMFENGIVVGARCVRCGIMVLYVDGKVPDDIQAQDCTKEDASQAAVRIVREATKD